MSSHEPIIVTPKLSSAGQALLNEGQIVRTISSGCTSTIYIFKRGNSQFVLKDTSDAHFANWLEREAHFLNAMRNSSLPHAQIVDFKREGASASLVLAYVEGQTVTELLARTNPTERSDLWADIGAALKIFHTTPPPTELPVCSSTDWLDSMLNLAEEHLINGRADGGTDAILKRLRGNKPSAIPATLIHGDCTTDNILFQGRTLTAFVDLPFGGVGDRRQDLSYLLRGRFPPSANDLGSFSESYELSMPKEEEIRYFQDLYLFF